MKEQTDYATEKEKNEQKLVRNEFLYYNMSAGKYDFPIIKRQDIDADEIKFLSFEDAKKEDAENRDKTIHFFTYDWKFEKVYENINDIKKDFFEKTPSDYNYNNEFSPIHLINLIDRELIR